MHTVSCRLAREELVHLIVCFYHYRYSSWDCPVWRDAFEFVSRPFNDIPPIFFQCSVGEVYSDEHRKRCTYLVWACSELFLSVNCESRFNDTSPWPNKTRPTRWTSSSKLEYSQYTPTPLRCTVSVFLLLSAGPLRIPLRRLHAQLFTGQQILDPKKDQLTADDSRGRSRQVLGIKRERNNEDTYDIVVLHNHIVNETCWCSWFARL